MKVPIGMEMRFDITFTDTDDTFVDPTVVKFIIKDPDNDEEIFVYNTDPELVRESIGVYYCLRIMNKAGRWVSRFVTTGNVNSATPDEITIVTGTELSV